MRKRLNRFMIVESHMYSFSCCQVISTNYSMRRSVHFLRRKRAEVSALNKSAPDLLQKALSRTRYGRYSGGMDNGYQTLRRSHLLKLRKS